MKLCISKKYLTSFIRWNGDNFHEIADFIRWGRKDNNLVPYLKENGIEKEAFISLSDDKKEITFPNCVHRLEKAVIGDYAVRNTSDADQISSCYGHWVMKEDHFNDHYYIF